MSIDRTFSIASSHSRNPVEAIENTFPTLQTNVQVGNGPNPIPNVTAANNRNLSGSTLSSVIVENNPRSLTNASPVPYRSRFNSNSNNAINANLNTQGWNADVSGRINSAQQFQRTIIRIQPPENNAITNNTSMIPVPVAATVQSMYALNESWHPILPSIINTTLGTEENNRATNNNQPPTLSTFIRNSGPSVSNDFSNASSTPLPTLNNHDLGYSNAFPHASIWRKKKKHSKLPPTVIGKKNYSA